MRPTAALPDGTPAEPRRRTGFGPCQRGATAVEFALLAVPFFVLVFALFETALVFASDLVLDRGVQAISRQIRLGETRAMMRGEFEDVLCREVEIILDCKRLAYSLETYERWSDVSLAAETATTPAGSRYGPTRADAIVLLEVAYAKPLTFGLLQRTFSRDGSATITLVSSSLFQTEPYE